MARAVNRTREFVMISADPQDRDRVNALAARLTADGPGKFGQAETIRYLLNCYESAIETFGQPALDIANERHQ